MSLRVVVIGAGYAGVSAANRLALTAANVTLVNPRTEFVERIRLHQLVAGTRAATLPLTSLLARSVTFVQDFAESIDVDRQSVRLATGQRVGFDYLIYAAGSRNGLDVIPGAYEHAVTIGDLESALIARERLNQLPAGSTVAVVGGGLTGIELAAELAETSSYAIRLVTSGPIAASVGDRARAYLRRYLAALRVDIIEGTGAAEVQHGKLLLTDGRTLDSDLSVMTAQAQMPTLARDSGLAVAANNALRVSRTLVSLSAPNIAAAGDSAHIDAAPLRPSCQAALPLGVHAADTVRHLMNGTRPKSVRPKFIGQVISLGRRSALVQSSTFSDRPTPVIVTGPAAALFKEQVGTSIVRFGLNHKHPRLAYSWSI
jgi:NADH dehydrogenase